jgi:hypothetical protein
MKNNLLLTSILIAFLIFSQSTKAQPVPATEENIPYLMTFGNDAKTSWGDDDFTQIFFFSIPKTYSKTFFIRVYDPEAAGKLDELIGTASTKMKYTVYGGKGCISNKDARSTDTTGKYDSGNQLATKTFGTETTYDQKWYSFGPFNPTSGELQDVYGGYVFKIIVKGISGDDGNLYKFYLSETETENIALEGSNAFTFEYSFRMNDAASEVSHLYPYIDDKTISVKQSNFDWDNDGELKFVSKKRIAVHLEKSPDNKWVSSEHAILDEEKSSTIDVQFHKNKTKPAKNNNIVFNITNQYGEALPFYTIPIGGIPKPPESKIILKKKK